VNEKTSSSSANSAIFIFMLPFPATVRLDVDRRRGESGQRDETAIRATPLRVGNIVGTKPLHVLPHTATITSSTHVHFMLRHPPASGQRF